MTGAKPDVRIALKDSEGHLEEISAKWKQEKDHFSGKVKVDDALIAMLQPGKEIPLFIFPNTPKPKSLLRLKRQRLKSIDDYQIQKSQAATSCLWFFIQGRAFARPRGRVLWLARDSAYDAGKRPLSTRRFQRETKGQTEIALAQPSSHRPRGRHNPRDLAQSHRWFLVRGRETCRQALSD
jgi:hypothetical protein